MSMQDVTIWWFENCNFSCILKFQCVKIISQTFTKIDLNNFVAHHFSYNTRWFTEFHLFLPECRHLAPMSSLCKPNLKILHCGPKVHMYKIQDFPNLEFFHVISFQINSKKTTFTMAMQDVTVQWSKNYNFACILKFQCVKMISQTFQKLN